MPLRIILADDHLIVRQGLRSILEREAYTVLGEAGDGREALRLAEELRPDVAVLDLAMPLLNGLDAAREISRVSAQTKTILVTMQTEDPYEMEALPAGLQGYLVNTQAADDRPQATPA